MHRSGIIFDVIECLIQRNFGYATTDVRVCYSILKETLYNAQNTKVIFILHSQGGIQGSLVLDWLLQELPQDLLAKLEVYTFGKYLGRDNDVIIVFLIPLVVCIEVLLQEWHLCISIVALYSHNLIKTMIF